MTATKSTTEHALAQAATRARSPKRRPANKRVLTELYIRKVKPKGTGFVVWDLKQRGLVLRVRPSGNRSWYAVYSRHGRPRWLRLGHADAIALSDARKLAGKAMLAVAEGHDPAAEKKAERGAGTFAELHAKYLDQHAKKHNKSWKQGDALIKRNVLPRWAKLQASTITRGDVKQMMASIDAPIVANQTLAAVSAIFTWGTREDIVAANPCRQVARNPTSSRERVLSASELPKFWKALDDIEPVAATALKTILLTGQRPGEVSSMRFEHVKDGWWELPGSPIAGIWPGTKNGQSHRIWLPKAVRALIGQGTTGFVFAGPRGRAVYGLDIAMRSICGRLGIERATPHDLRRTFGSLVTGLGHGRQAMDRILNHADNSIGSVYDRHGYAEENKRIMESVASRIIALAEGRAESNVVSLKR